MAIYFIAFIWGFAEATLFFIVPDVAISIASLNGIDIGLTACVYALIGALIGGAVMFYWGRSNIENVVHILSMIPAIRPKDIEKVRTDLEKAGIKTVLFGPLIGIPYKIYAAHAHLVTSIYYFLLLSVLARIVRFVLVAFITPYIIGNFFPQATYSSQVQIVLIIWTILYIIYFIVKRK